MINQLKQFINEQIKTTGQRVEDNPTGKHTQYAQGILRGYDRVLQEIERLEAIEAEKISYTRVNSDSYGNPRYVVSYFNLLTPYEQETLHYSEKYDYAAKRANRIGGSKYRGKDYAGGIVFQSYNMAETIEDIKKLLKEAKEKEPAPEAVK